MTKLKTFFRRLFAGSFKRMFMHIGIIHKETGKSRFIMFFDMIWCIFRYQIGYLDYRVFGFARIKGKNRRTFMTMNDNLIISRKLNNKEYFHIFDNKAEFDEIFKDYIGRGFLDLRTANETAFKSFCADKTVIFAKALNNFGGQGITKENVTPDTDFSALYKKLTDNGQYLIEEAIIQHPDMNKLSPSSINTMRMVTLYYNNEVNFMYALVRMSNGTACVDNICSGGMYVSINDDGVITKPAFCDETGLYYDEHPFTHTKFNGFKIPMFDEAKEMCKKAALVQTNVAYIGWDVAITPSGPVLVEGNTLPSYDMCQNYGHIDNKTGVKPKFEGIVGKNFFK